MTLPLTPEMLRAAYDYLRVSAPYDAWNLPDGDEVVFRVGRSHDTRGWYKLEKGRHVITVSARCIGRTDSLMAVMAHEMVHLETPGAQHNAAFNKLAAKVCRLHGFDPKLF
jgi:hypothetical protein